MQCLQWSCSPIGEPGFRRVVRLARQRGVIDRSVAELLLYGTERWRSDHAENVWGSTYEYAPGIFCTPVRRKVALVFVRSVFAEQPRRQNKHNFIGSSISAVIQPPPPFLPLRSN